MSFGPTGRCTFCEGIYYLEKLPAHETICSRRPVPKQLASVVRAILEVHPEALKDKALLVRLTWKIIDGYHTDPPLARLSDPAWILASARSFSKRQASRKSTEI
jgi:hypothetical protein